jgi:hypothetical protein
VGASRLVKGEAADSGLQKYKQTQYGVSPLVLATALTPSLQGDNMQGMPNNDNNMHSRYLLCITPSCAG